MFLDPVLTNSMPSAWFLGLFDRLRGSSEPETLTLAHRAVLATVMALGGASLVSVAAFQRQTQLALAPSALVHTLGKSRIRRTLARLLVGGDRVARGTADFILMTVARCRAEQALIAINAAVGAGLATAALVRNTPDMTSLCVFKPHSLTASAANASGFVQTA